MTGPPAWEWVATETRVHLAEVLRCAEGHWYARRIRCGVPSRPWRRPCRHSPPVCGRCWTLWAGDVAGDLAAGSDDEAGRR